MTQQNQTTIVQIEPYSEHLVPAVRAFNKRLRQKGILHRFPETAHSLTLPPLGGRSIFHEYYLAREGDTVRGGYILKRQKLALKGAILPIGNYQFPLSEGIVDPQYVSLGVRFVRHAMKKEPQLYSLGLGGKQEAIARLLGAAKWRLTEVPFYFKVLHAAPFLRNLAMARNSTARRLLADALAQSRLGAAGLFLFDRLWARIRVRPDQSVRCERVNGFDSWADDLWQRCLDRYRLMMVRDGETLRALYPKEQSRFIRLRLLRGDSTIGWAVVLATQMVDHKAFGNMRLGTLVDCLALPEETEAVALAALSELSAAGCDLVVSNQSHFAWCSALERCGFVRGPSNFLLALSPALAQKVEPLERHIHEIHVTRGDGDGPYNL